MKQKIIISTFAVLLSIVLGGFNVNELSATNSEFLKSEASVEEWSITEKDNFITEVPLLNSRDSISSNNIINSNNLTSKMWSYVSQGASTE